MTENLPEVLENEWYIVRYSGETPEIAFHSSLYQLSRAQGGPLIKLTDKQVELLKNAAVDRFIEIILRDMQHANSAKSIYRGICRSIINYHRYCIFCSRQGLDVSQVRCQAAEVFLAFLETEIHLLQRVNRPTLINCTYMELQSFARELGVELGDTFTVLTKLCPSTS